MSRLGTRAGPPLEPRPRSRGYRQTDRSCAAPPGGDPARGGV